MRKSLTILVLLMFSLNNSTCGQVKADDIIGVWMTVGNEPTKIRIYRTGEKYYGKIVWLKYPTNNGKPKLDTKNPDKNKRNQPVTGMVIMREFQFDGRDEWENGRIYDPESGKTYSCYLSLKDKNTMKVRGYIGIALVGRTEVWTRAEL
ncbi:DUF2147 domain-containing protein [Chitinophagaceae bacterium LB-8]|uniref:DUF2147 domain-containing protein n=1 Tax=Paraflavisolibacter caeni TaxID=2982496 RepID=A0A9X2XP54_9BACT|nr:DUF2147 domain-containing protein [Paraflavisolibacter caeni]MCU7550483.1 DUF2147 domain-containing protein [Paraflavisolibacter caeni]